MKIDRILAGIREAKTEKTAAAKPAAPVAPAMEKTAAPREKLLGALNDALSTTKTAGVATPAAPAASAGSPVADVMKVAQEIAASEDEAAKKQAALLGQAFIDGAISRYNDWQKTAAAMPAPAVAPVADAQLKLASEQGYTETRAQLEKQAEDAYVDGYNSTVLAIHKTASLEFIKAAQVTGRILDTIAAAK